MDEYEWERQRIGEKLDDLVASLKSSEAMIALAVELGLTTEELLTYIVNELAERLAADG